MNRLRLAKLLDKDTILAEVFRETKKEPTPLELAARAEICFMQRRDLWFVSSAEEIAQRWPTLVAANIERCIERVARYDQRYYQDALDSIDYADVPEGCIMAAAFCLVVCLYTRLVNASCVPEGLYLTPDEAAAWISEWRCRIPEQSGQYKMF